MESVAFSSDQVFDESVDLLCHETLSPFPLSSNSPLGALVPDSPTGQDEMDNYLQPETLYPPNSYLANRKALQDVTINPEVELVNPNCVIYNYFTGDPAKKVDQHFKRSLNTTAASYASQHAANWCNDQASTQFKPSNTALPYGGSSASPSDSSCSSGGSSDDGGCEDLINAVVSNQHQQQY